MSLTSIWWWSLNQKGMQRWRNWECRRISLGNGRWNPFLGDLQQYWNQTCNTCFWLGNTSFVYLICSAKLRSTSTSLLGVFVPSSGRRSASECGQFCCVSHVFPIFFGLGRFCRARNKFGIECTYMGQWRFYVTSSPSCFRTSRFWYKVRFV